ncbi:carbohydrate-binding module family 35 protein [Annulohypoxylon maeteangense]|uniref:carbohydrate-binding module family 35 protein n=1 Tax=Annulohypoxylon maeteangense TaxID=1927788 RepID=UPI002007D740|nr:carbohydrate-binding module family 35 protein [Annulohypoxylon maeteangense]KAI0883568.1 carbohydrate-binding module family 35 protein [Annulohypoxylon maeteangense]
MKSVITSALLLGASVEAALYKSKTPPMGWNSYNYYNCNPNEEIMHTNAQGLVDLGLADLGYQYVTTDCGWMAKDRDSQNRLQWNAALFPSGVQALEEFIHGLGLKFGLYSGAGYYQCGSTDLPASLGYEEIDAQTFSDWKGDSLKYDNCFASSKTVAADYTSAVSKSPARHQKMAAILEDVDREIAYFICQWGVGEDLGEWAPPISNVYRISNDIYNGWRSIWRIANQVVPFYRSTTVGAYPDMDMLIIGLNALSLQEEKFHFSMWAINKSPLNIGAPTNTKLTPAASFDVLKNKEVIAINQDPLGKQARLVRRHTEEEWDIWAGELSGGRTVVGIANWKNGSQTVEFDLSTVNVASANARDVWAAKDIGAISGVQKFELAGHEMRLLVLSNIVKPNTLPKSSGKYYSAADATFGGSAKEVGCNADTCLPKGNKISIPSQGATATFNSVIAGSQGTKLLGIDFINYDVALNSAWGWGSNTRNMTVAVNGGTAKRWAFPISGGDWSESDRLVIEVDGFVAGGNKVVLAAYGDSSAPDIVGFEVLE